MAFFWVCCQNAIAKASSLAEVERLKGMLQAGHIPGRERTQGLELAAAPRRLLQTGAPHGFSSSPIDGAGVEEEDEGHASQMDAQMEEVEDMEQEPHVNGS